MARIAWLGLGGIGKAICLNIVKYGQYEESVAVWNRTHQTAVDFASEAAKMVVVGSVAEAVAVCDIICLCLADDAAVNQVVDAAIETSHIAGKLFVDLSTIHPNTAAEQHSKLKLHGADYLASPIFGGVPLAVHRQITLVLAGSSDAIERFRPFTDDVICKNSILLRDQPCRQASILKLVGNYVRLSAIRSLGEGLALSEALGLAPQTLASFAETMNISPTPQQIQMLLSGGYYKDTKPTVPMSMVVKENDYLSDLMSQAGAQVATFDELVKTTNRLVEARGANASILGLFGVLREDCGLPFENQARDE